MPTNNAKPINRPGRPGSLIKGGNGPLIKGGNVPPSQIKSPPPPPKTSKK